MFVDQVKVHIKAGKGGDGLVSFRHEKYVAYGGPFGGDGGNGGDVIFEADPGMTTLLDLRYHRKIIATPGEKGKNKKMHGANGEHKVVKVPLGTIVKRSDNNQVLADLTKPHQRQVVAHGGRGGRGNWHFRSSHNTAPKYAEQGVLGEEFDCVVELRVLADVGLVGFPSVGKSTFLSVVTNARPEIAAYPFTTIEPNIGVVDLGNEKGFVLADMPGLIEGAGEGRGLGHEFLRHIRRCRVLIHVIDMSGEAGDPVECYDIINKELATYDADLEKKPQIVVANKMDDEYASMYLDEFKKAYPDIKIYEVSTLKHIGLKEVLYAAMDEIDNAKVVEAENAAPIEETIVYRYQPKRPDFYIEKDAPGRWKVVSQKIDNLVDTYDLDDPDQAYQLGLQLDKMGVDQALREAGARDGDQVIVNNYILDFKD